MSKDYGGPSGNSKKLEDLMIALGEKGFTLRAEQFSALASNLSLSLEAATLAQWQKQFRLR